MGRLLPGCFLEGILRQMYGFSNLYNQHHLLQNTESSPAKGTLYRLGTNNAQRGELLFNIEINFTLKIDFQTSEV